MAYVVAKDDLRPSAQAASTPAASLRKLSADEIADLDLKMRGPGVRKDEPGRPSFSLGAGKVEQEILAGYDRRRSHRQFQDSAIVLDDLSRLLTALPADFDLGVYLFAKANRVSGLAGGAYSYDPTRRCLRTVLDSAEIERDTYGSYNRAIFDRAAFALLFVGRAEAGRDEQKRALFAIGRQVQRLMTIAPEVGLGLCSIGTLDFARLRALLGMSDEPLLHSLLGGKIGEASSDAAGTGESAAPAGPRELTLSMADADGMAGESHGDFEILEDDLELSQLAAMLGVLRPLLLPGSPLPKYLYPSAGSLYPVQTYL